MHWICPLDKLSTCWLFVEVLSSGVFKWPPQWLNMFSIPKISQRLMLKHIHPLRTRKCLAALLVSELIDEDKKAKKRRGKTKAWIWRRSSKGCCNNIKKELLIKDTAGCLNSQWIRWALRVRGLNMLSVAVQMHSSLLSHTSDRETKEMLSRFEERSWPVQIWLNKTQHLSTPLNRVFKCAQLVDLNKLRACTMDKSSAFARCFTQFFS